MNFKGFIENALKAFLRVGLVITNVNKNNVIPGGRLAGQK
jgi:hypothetical protein